MLRSFGRFAIRRPRSYIGQPNLPGGKPEPAPIVETNKSDFQVRLEAVLKANSDALKPKPRKPKKWSKNKIARHAAKVAKNARRVAKQKAAKLERDKRRLQP